MMLNLHTLAYDEPYVLNLTGSEEWLEPLHQEFSKKVPGEPAKITGDLEFSRMDETRFYVSGEIRFTPFVSCGRCDMVIPWAVKEEVHLYLETSSKDMPEMVDLSEEDLAEEFVEGDQFDVVGFIRETINLGLPTRTTPEVDEDGDCLACFENVTAEMVFSSNPEALSEKAPSPFAKLKNIKLAK